jgi:hypothetical protein
LARFHLGQGVGLEIDADGHSGCLRTGDGARVSWSTTCPAHTEESQWHPRFGTSIPTRCLVVPLDRGRLTTTLRVSAP